MISFSPCAQNVMSSSRGDSRSCRCNHQLGDLAEYETFMECPWYGSRQMALHLGRAGHEVGRRRVRRLMGKMGLAPIYQRPRTSDPHPQHRVYPYLLRKLAIERPNYVWCADVTYIPMRRGFLYLVVVMDWATRKVLAWRLSSQLKAGLGRWMTYHSTQRPHSGLAGRTPREVYRRIGQSDHGRHAPHDLMIKQAA